MKWHEQRIEANIPGQARLDYDPAASRFQNDEIAIRYMKPKGRVGMNLDKGVRISRVQICYAARLGP